MKILHILRSRPDDEVGTLMEGLSRDADTTEIRLYEGDVDYEELVDLIFSHDRVVSWW